MLLSDFIITSFSKSSTKDKQSAVTFKSDNTVKNLEGKECNTFVKNCNCSDGRSCALLIPCDEKLYLADDYDDLLLLAFAMRCKVTLEIEKINEIITIGENLETDEKGKVFKIVGITLLNQ